MVFIRNRSLTLSMHIELLQNMSLKQRCFFCLHDRKQLARLVELVMIGSTNYRNTVPIDLI